MIQTSINSLIFFGAGGHAKVIIEAAIRQKQEIAYILDNDIAKKSQCLINFEIKIYHPEIDLSKFKFVVTIGNNKARKQWYEYLLQKTTAGTIVHPSAVVTDFCHIGAGTVVLGNANINPGVYIGENVIINTGAVVEHDCNIGGHAHIAPNATLCGGVSIGECTFIGAGATVLPGITIGNNVIVGAGSVVISDVPNNAKIVGNPARNI